MNYYTTCHLCGGLGWGWDCSSKLEKLTDFGGGSVAVAGAGLRSKLAKLEEGGGAILMGSVSWSISKEEKLEDCRGKVEVGIRVGKKAKCLMNDV